jgi:hypothetical protein
VKAFSLSTARCATVSPEVGIEGLSERSHLPAVIRKAGLEWTARREDGQGAIHSPFRSITGDRGYQPGQSHRRSGRTFCCLGPCPESITPTAPDAVAPFAAVELPLELSAAQPRAPTER